MMVMTGIAAAGPPADDSGATVAAGRLERQAPGQASRDGRRLGQDPRQGPPGGSRLVTVRVDGKKVKTVKTRKDGTFRVRWSAPGAGVYKAKAIAQAPTRQARPLAARRSTPTAPPRRPTTAPACTGTAPRAARRSRPRPWASPTSRCHAAPRSPSATAETPFAPVIDRGPYAGNREWDLTAALKAKLGFGSTGSGPHHLVARGRTYRSVSGPAGWPSACCSPGASPSAPGPRADADQAHRVLADRSAPAAPGPRLDGVGVAGGGGQGPRAREGAERAQPDLQRHRAARLLVRRQALADRVRQALDRLGQLVAVGDVGGEGRLAALGLAHPVDGQVARAGSVAALAQARAVVGAEGLLAAARGRRRELGDGLDPGGAQPLEGLRARRPGRSDAGFSPTVAASSPRSAREPVGLVEVRGDLRHQLVRRQPDRADQPRRLLDPALDLAARATGGRGSPRGPRRPRPCRRPRRRR